MYKAAFPWERCIFRAFRFLENLKPITETLRYYSLLIYYRICLPRTKYIGLCII